MKWSDLKLRTKISIGFSIVLMLLIITSLTGSINLNKLLGNSQNVVTTDNLVAEMIQREVDHLKWTNSLMKFVFDEREHKLEIGLDHTRCGFGRWYYGEGRKLAEQQYPNLTSKFRALEQPHKELHQSAIKIQQVYRMGNVELLQQALSLEGAHLAWANTVKDNILLQQSSVGVQLDHK